MKYIIDYDKNDFDSKLVSDCFLPLNEDDRYKITRLIYSIYAKEFDVNIIREEMFRSCLVEITLAVPDNISKMWWISWGHTRLKYFRNMGDNKYVFSFYMRIE